MTKETRRSFITKSAALGAGAILGPTLSMANSDLSTNLKADKKISLAQWALVDEMRAGEWKNSDFPRVAREELGITGIEFVNTLFEVPTVRHLNNLKNSSKDLGVTMLLIMIDAEGDGAEPTDALRKQFVTNHRKWIDIAEYLGCSAIRTNCRGPEGVDPKEGMKFAVESYQMLLEHAHEANIKVTIENHGGLSDDADWMVNLMKAVDDPMFGTYPDWRRPGIAYDNLVYLQKTIPYAHGTSYRNQPSDEETIKMIKTCQDAGYTGWYGIESSGREAIKKGVNMLKKHL